VFRPEPDGGSRGGPIANRQAGVDTACKPTRRSAPPSCFVKSFPKTPEFTESRRVTFIPAVQEVPAYAVTWRKPQGV